MTVEKAQQIDSVERVSHPDVPALRAQIMEYEHALEHIAECKACKDCWRLAQSALYGLNREMCLEMVTENEQT